MHPFILQTYQRFKSAVPAIVKKIQIILGFAAGTFTASANINWPGKMAVISIISGYAAAVCAGAVLALQFIQQTVAVCETPTDEHAPADQNKPVITDEILTHDHHEFN